MINASENNIGVSKVIEPFHIVATQLKTLTPVGTGAPMMQVNHVNYENLTKEKVDKILDKIK